MQDEQLIKELTEAAARLLKTVADIETVIGMVKERMAIRPTSQKTFVDKLGITRPAGSSKGAQRNKLKANEQNQTLHDYMKEVIVPMAKSGKPRLSFYKPPVDKPKTGNSSPGIAAAMANQADRILKQRPNLTERQKDHLEAVKAGAVRLDMQNLPTE